MLNIKEIGLEIEGNEIFSNVNFDISIGDKISLVGENGVGKSSLLKILSGNIQPSNGFIHKQKDLEISLMPQNLDKWEDNTVYEFTEEFTGVKKARENFDEACNNLTQIYTPKQSFIYEKSLKKYEHLGVYDFEQRLKKSLNNVGLKDLDINTRLKEISGGQKNRIALSAILTSKKDLILLDEPTNNLDSEGILILEKFINQSKSSFIIVSHNI